MRVDRLIAIYNVWADAVELLRGSIDTIKDHVDEIVIVYQQCSNYGEEVDTLKMVQYAIDGLSRIHLVEFKPFRNQPASYNEKLKRNIGLDTARLLQGTHFLHLDSDEYYLSFGNLKRSFEISGYDGSVLSLKTYFKKPTLMFENEEKYFVPFIHKLRKGTIAGNAPYPFYVDPTRRINETNVVLLSGHMHHYSWVRSDIYRKVRNSSAKQNIERSGLIDDWKKADVGYYIKDYDTKLIEVQNYFNITI